MPDEDHAPDGMNREQQQRLAANEALARDVNEAIERGAWPGENGLIAFRCECSHPSCNELLRLTPEIYQEIRAGPRRFVVLRGHELPELETTIRTEPGYVIVEKRGVAGAVAEATDPRG